MKKLLLLVVLAVFMAGLISATQPTKLAVYGTAEGIEDGNINIRVSTAESCTASIIYDQNYVGALQDNDFNILLGNAADLNLNYNQDYYMCVYVNDILAISAMAFVGGHGKIAGSDLNFSAVGVITSADSNFANLGISGQTFVSDFVNLHADPVLPLHAATKEYVDIAVSGLEFDFFLTDSASDIADYNVLVDTDTGQAESIITSIALNAGADQLIFNFATEAGKPEFNSLLSSVYDLHAHFEKTGGLAKTITFYWELWERDSGGTETEILTSEESSEITSKEKFDVHAVLSDDERIDANRLVVKVYANVVGGGATAQIIIYQEGTTDSHISLKPPNTALSELFLSRAGTNWMNADLNLGGNTLQNGDVNATGDSNFASLEANNIYAGNLTCSLDANFASLEADNIYSTGDGTFDELNLTSPTDNYKIAGDVDDIAVSLQNQTSGQDAALAIYPKDGDTTDRAYLYLYRTGTPADHTGMERVVIACAQTNTFFNFPSGGVTFLSADGYSFATGDVGMSNDLAVVGDITSSTGAIISNVYEFIPTNTSTIASGAGNTIDITTTTLNVDGKFTAVEDSNFLANVQIVGTLFGGSPISLGSGNKRYIIDFENETASWCTKTSEQWACGNPTTKILKKLDQTDCIDKGAGWDYDGTACIANPIEECEARGRFYYYDKQCLFDYEQECYSQGKEYYWDGECKVNLYWDCFLNQQDTKSWDFKTSKCAENPIKVCELRDDMVWDSSASACIFSQGKQGARIIKECLSDRTKFWNGTSCANASTLQAG